MKDEEETKTKTERETKTKTATNRTFAQIICVAFISRKQIAKVLQTDCATLRRPQTRLDFGQLACPLPLNALPSPPNPSLLSMQSGTEQNGTLRFCPDPLLLASTTGMTCCCCCCSLWWIRGEGCAGLGYLKVLPLCRHKSLAVKSQLAARASCSNLRPVPSGLLQQNQNNFKWSRSRSRQRQT